VSVRVVDLEPFIRGGPDEQAHVAAEVDDACRRIGFLAVVGHGVPEQVRADAFAAARSFFDLPLEDRMRVAMPVPGYPYGYNPFCAEALEHSIGGHAPPDLKETFNIGPIDPPPRPVAEMTDPDERAVHAPNRWPDEFLPGFRPALETYYRSMASLASQLLAVFGRALGLSATYFDPFVDRHGSALRLAHYPALPDESALVAGQLRAGAHTDYGTLTILATDDEPGLQVQDFDGSWIDVPHVAGAYVVNLGDLMARWTNDRWRSTMHRVVVPADGGHRRRITLPFFHNANWDARVECIVAAGDEARYRPVLAGEHLMSKFRSTVANPPVA
jgi:isopenicillin N synthase-like dioxygenase